ncbi:hypothetical protein ACHWQZ_G009517 [Mnemiopsis leidyi]
MKLRRDVASHINTSTTPISERLFDPDSFSPPITTYQELWQHILLNPARYFSCDSGVLARRWDFARLDELDEVDVQQCADFALHISLIVFLTVMIVSCVYVCRSPARRKVKMMSVEVQTEDIEIFSKDQTSSSPTSSPPLDHDRQKLRRPLSEVVPPRFGRQMSERNHIPPSPLATSDLAASICSLQSATSSHIRNNRKLLKKSNTMVAFPSNTLQNILTSDSYRKLASNSTISGPPSSAYKYTYKPISAVFSTSDSNLSEKASSKKTTQTRFEARPVD